MVALDPIWNKKFLKGEYENEMKKDYDEFENLEISPEDISEYYEETRDSLSGSVSNSM